MKKALSWLIVVAMLIAMMPAVFAAEGDTVAIDDGQYVISYGDYTYQALAESKTYGYAPAGDVTAPTEADYITITNQGDGTFTMTDCYGRLIYMTGTYNSFNVGTDVTEGHLWTLIEVEGGYQLMNVDKEKYVSYSASYGTWGSYANPGDNSILTLTPVASEEEEEPVVNTELALGDNALAIEAGIADSAEYSFTATEAGTLALTIDALSFVATDGETAWDEDLATTFPLTFTVNGEVVEGNATTVEVAVGDVVTVMLTQNRMYVNNRYAWNANLNIAYQAAEEPEVPENALVLGNNALIAGAEYVAEQVEYGYIAEQAGTLYITVRTYGCNGNNWGEDAFGFENWTNMYINGERISTLNNSVEVNVGDVVTVTLESVDGDCYDAQVYLSYEGFYEEPKGSELNPVYVMPADLPTSTLEIGAGEALYYEFDHTFQGYTLYIYGEDAYILIYQFSMETWTNEPYYIYAVDGVVEYKFENYGWYTIQIGNAGTEAQSFEIDGAIPVGSQTNPDTLIIGEQTADVPNDYSGYTYVWTAPEAGTLTITVTGEHWVYYLANRTTGEEYYHALINGNENVVTLTVNAGDQVLLNLTTYDEYYNTPGGLITVLAEFAPAGGSEEPDVENPLVLGVNALEQNITYTYVAEQDGVLELIFSNVLYDGNGNTPASQLGNWCSLFVNGEAITAYYNTLEVKAGDHVTVLLTPVDSSVYTADLELRYQPDPIALTQGDNNLDQYTPYIYVAEQTGTLYFTVKDIVNDMYGSGDEGTLGWGLKIEINGEAITSFKHSIEVTEGDEIAVYMTPLYYNWTALLNISYEGFYEHPLGSEKNPIYLSYADCPTVTPEIPAGEEFCYELNYDMAQSTMTIYGENAYIVVEEWSDDAMAYVDVRYYAENGVLTYYVSSNRIRIGNAGTEAAVFDIEAYFAPGHYNNPAELIIGDNIADVPAYNSYYLYYDATEDGTLTLTITGDLWAFNYVNEGASEGYEDDVYGTAIFQANGDSNVVTIEVKAGDHIAFTVWTYDPATWSSPAATITITAEFAGVGGEEEILAEGEIAVETTDTYGWFDLYSMTAEVTGTYTFYVPAGLGVWSVESYNNWGNPEIGFYDNTEGYSFSIDLTEGEEFAFYVGAQTKGEWVITYTVVASSEGGEGGEGGGEEGGGEEGGVPSDAVDLVIGNNSINAADITYVYTAPTAGTLILNLGNAIMGPVEGVVTVNFENAQNLYTMGQITLELAQGDIVLVTMTASGYATLTAEWETEGGEGGDTPVDPSEPDGTMDNPYIIEEMPYEGTQEFEQDLYYQWTAPENGTLYVYTDGVCTMNGSSVASTEYVEGGKSLKVAGGDVIIINIWSANNFTLEFVPSGSETEPGTIGNPIAIESLNITLTIADDGIYYVWTAPEAGEVVVRIAETTWSYGYNLTLNGEALFGEGSEMTLTLEAGDQVVVMIEVYPSASSDGHLTLEEVVEAPHEHNYVETDRQEATCTEDGYITYTCECGDTYTEVIEATGHNHVETDRKEATCDEDGYITYTCECGDTYTETIPATGHTFVDGECHCGAVDPNYNPETGSMNVMAVALMAAMSVTAVVVTARKKSDEE